MLTTRLKRDVIFLAFISSNFILLHHLPALSKPCGADVLQDGTAILVHAGCTEEPPHNTQEGQGMHDLLDCASARNARHGRADERGPSNPPIRIEQGPPASQIHLGEGFGVEGNPDGSWRARHSQPQFGHGKLLDYGRWGHRQSSAAAGVSGPSKQYKQIYK